MEQNGRRVSSYRSATCVGLLIALGACSEGSGETGRLDAQVAADAGQSAPDAADAKQTAGDAGGAADAGGATDAGGAADASGAADAGGTADAGLGRAPSLEDLDLTLDGLNQDLTVPPGNCMHGDSFSKRCLSISGVYNGAPFQFSCTGDMLDESSIAPMYIRCRGPGPAGMVTVMVSLARDLVWRPTKLMQVDGESGATRAYLSSGARDFNDRPNSGTFVLVPTHTLSFRLQGLSEHAPYGDLPYAYWVMRGVFAVSVLPKPGCAPTTQLACDEMRVRGAFFTHVSTMQGDM